MNFSMMIGLAVGIDYSLFIVSRYREERAEGKDAIAAIENTMSTAGKAVFLSALTVVLSLAAVFLVPVMVFRSMALGMILSVVAVALAALTLLPAVLVALGRQGARHPGQEGPRHRRREPLGPLDRRSRCAAPARVLAIGLVLLGALVVPAFGMHLGMPGARVVDQGRTSRDGYDTGRRSRSGPAPPRPPSSPSPPPTPSTVVDDRHGRPQRRRRPRRHRRRRRPAASWCASPPGPRSTTRRPPTMVDRLRTELDTAVPDGQGRRPGRAEPRPHRRAHRTRAATRSASS